MPSGSNFAAEWYMPSQRHISIKAGDTEPQIIQIDATDLDDLSNLASAVVYFRKEGETTNHVDGVALTVESSASRTLRFDPVDAKNGGGNAFDAVGKYLGYVVATWSDGDITRHPGNGWLAVNANPTYE